VTMIAVTTVTAIATAIAAKQSRTGPAPVWHDPKAASLTRLFLRSCDPLSPRPLVALHACFRSPHVTATLFTPKKLN
jgi:hypothetical protein